MVGDTVHGKEEFENIDWDMVDRMNNDGRVSFGQGGNYLPDGTWVLTMTKDDGVYRDVYVLPNYLQYMMDTVKRWGKEGAINEVRGHVGHVFDLLGIEVRGL